MGKMKQEAYCKTGDRIRETGDGRQETGDMRRETSDERGLEDE